MDRRLEPEAWSSSGTTEIGGEIDSSAGAQKARSASVDDARASLANWLSTRRIERRLGIDDVARITKIQPRILERLESGQLDGLPADVFVRGFVRSFARCI